ncbi:CsbD family protein [Rhodococcus sp. IEGM 1307]|uniref:CsbD family protein n=1 Tax=Rhodococcus sp. IEGM 1307 TaxID=3047091 RepID=UPI0024B7F2BF|nr:CsbD family protein [Rhodococcus sp. IEGM 1307]MDI9980266.1 CsbD family protein [Rhodococcus sp. IEGM 1307]
MADKASNKAEDLTGQAKEATGKATGDPDLRDEGKADQAASAVKDAGEKVKDAAKNLKDKLS